MRQGREAKIRRIWRSNNRERGGRECRRALRPLRTWKPGAAAVAALKRQCDQIPPAFGNSNHAGHEKARNPRSVRRQDRKSTRLNSSHRTISYAVFCLKKKT